MPFDPKLADRIRKIVMNRKGFAEKKMFGGLTFMLNNNMLCGVETHRLMVRVGPEQHDELLKKPGAALMDLTGKPMLGFLFVNPDGVRTDRQLAFWIDRAHQYVSALPVKKPSSKSKKSDYSGKRKKP